MVFRDKCRNIKVLGYIRRTLCIVLIVLTTLIPSGVYPVFAEIADIENNDTVAETQVTKYLSAKTTIETGTTEELMTAVSAHCDYKVVMVNGEYSTDGVDDGKMLTDTTTPDGYYVDSTGLWVE